VVALRLDLRESVLRARRAAKRALRSDCVLSVGRSSSSPGVCDDVANGSDCDVVDVCAADDDDVADGSGAASTASANLLLDGSPSLSAPGEFLRLSVVGMMELIDV